MMPIVIIALLLFTIIATNAAMFTTIAKYRKMQKELENKLLLATTESSQDIHELQLDVQKIGDVVRRYDEDGILSKPLAPQVEPTPMEAFSAFVRDTIEVRAKYETEFGIINENMSRMQQFLQTVDANARQKIESATVTLAELDKRLDKVMAQAARSGEVQSDGTMMLSPIKIMNSANELPKIGQQGVLYCDARERRAYFWCDIDFKFRSIKG